MLQNFNVKQAKHEKILHCLGVSHVAGHTEGEVHGCPLWLAREKHIWVLGKRRRERVERECDDVKGSHC